MSLNLTPIFVSVVQICGFLNGASVQWVEEQKVPYATKGNEWVGFDNKRSYNEKVIFKLIVNIYHI